MERSEGTVQYTIIALAIYLSASYCLGIYLANAMFERFEIVFNALELIVEEETSSVASIVSTEVGVDIEKRAKF